MGRRNNKKRMIALAMALAMIVTAGCGKQGKDSEKTASTTNDNETRKTITVGIQQDANVEDFETNYFTKQLEEACNVNLDFVLFPADITEATQKLSVMVSGGTKLPDVLVGISICSQL